MPQGIRPGLFSLKRRSFNRVCFALNAALIASIAPLLFRRKFAADMFAAKPVSVSDFATDSSTLKPLLVR